jgi:3-dehydroquinate dehydratase
VANGQCAWDVETWQSWWKDVMALRTWFAVDLDWLVLDRLAGESLDWRGKFRSRHAYFSLHATLDEVASLLPEFEASAKHHNAGIKIAVPVRGARDLARLSEITKSLSSDHPLKIVVAMGAAGKAWRFGEFKLFCLLRRFAHSCWPGSLGKCAALCVW